MAKKMPLYHYTGPNYPTCTNKLPVDNKLSNMVQSLAYA